MRKFKDTFRDIIKRDSPGELPRVKSHKVDTVGMVPEESCTFHLLSASDNLFILIKFLDIYVIHVGNWVVRKMEMHSFTD